MALFEVGPLRRASVVEQLEQLGATTLVQGPILQVSLQAQHFAFAWTEDLTGWCQRMHRQAPELATLLIDAGASAEQARHGQAQAAAAGLAYRVVADAEAAFAEHRQQLQQAVYARLWLSLRMADSPQLLVCDYIV